ncbi:perlucin-like protein [Cherax quadricarinatus]|nr:type-2 ice-structuring protein-like [Cherax quadricarinatus]
MRRTVFVFFIICFISLCLSKHTDVGDIVNQMICNNKPSDEESCPFPFSSVRQECFYLSRVLRNWTEARHYCRKLGGDLATPTNPFVLYTYVVEQDAIIDEVDKHVWIGGKKSLDGVTWKWTNMEATVIDGGLWHPELPDARPDADCVYIHSGNARPLANFPCSDAYRFMCQYYAPTQHNIV